MDVLSWRTFNKNNHSCTASAGIWSKLPFYPDHLRFLQRAPASAETHLEQSGHLRGREKKKFHHKSCITLIMCQTWHQAVTLDSVSTCASFHTNESGFVTVKVAKIHICFGQINKSGVQFTQHVRTLHARPHRLQSAEKSHFNGNWNKRAKVYHFSLFHVTLQHLDG